MTDDRVTLRDIYNAVNSLESKIEKRIDKVEHEVDDLQAFQNRSLGVLGVIAMFTSAVTTFLWNRITGQT